MKPEKENVDGIKQTWKGIQRRVVTIEEEAMLNMIPQLTLTFLTPLISSSYTASLIKGRVD